MSISPRSATAPLPSPRRICAVMSGESPSASSTSAPAGSAETWLASIAHSAFSHRRYAHSAAAALISPSMTTGTRYRAPPRNTPQSAAISSPPSFESTSITSSASGRFTSIAVFTAWCFLASPSFDSPAPRPTSPSGAACSNTDSTAAEVVVLPMPISPVRMMSAPRSSCSRTSSAPVSIARTHSSRVIAGDAVMSSVPFRILRFKTPSAPAKSRIPMSTGKTSHPAQSAM